MRVGSNGRKGEGNMKGSWKQSQIREGLTPPHKKEISSFFFFFFLVGETGVYEGKSLSE